MKTVLVTGSSGFTGRYVVKDLQNKGYHVIGLVNSDPGESEIVCDLTKKDSVQELIHSHKPDGVIHLAALSYVAHEDQSAFYAVNVIGATNLLEALEAESIVPEKIVIAGSANIYGNSTAEVVSESDVPEPVNHYAASKLAMEFMVKTWFPHFPIIITRPFNYTGIGQDNKFLIPKIISHFRAGKKEIELGNLDVSRDFSDVRDVAMAYRLMLESDVKSEIVNICSGQDVSLASVIEMMEKIAGYSIDVSVNPDFVRKNEIKRLLGDNAKLKRLFGYTPRYTLESTLKDMFNK